MAFIKLTPPIFEDNTNNDTVVNDDEIVFLNQNRLFCFLAINPLNDDNAIVGSSILYLRIQISLKNFYLALVLNNLDLAEAQLNPHIKLHEDESLDKIIHGYFYSNVQYSLAGLPYVTFVVSSLDAIIPFFNYQISITPRVFYIIFVISILENDPNLYYFNNDYIEFTDINLELASMGRSEPRHCFRRKMVPRNKKYRRNKRT